MKKKSTWSRLVDVFNFLIRVAVVVLIILLVHTIYKGLHQDGYSIQPIQAPKFYVDNGYSNIVIANRIQDEINQIKRIVNSSRRDSLQITTSNTKNLDVDVMGIGVSSHSLTDHLRDLLGIETKYIGGELTRLGPDISLTLRVYEKPVKKITETIITGQESEAFDKLMKSAAVQILLQIDPYYVSVMYYHDGEYEKAHELFRQMINDKSTDEKWAYLAWGNMAKKQRNKDLAIEKYKKSLELDPRFVLPIRNLAWTHFTDKDFEKAIHYFKRSYVIDRHNFGSVNGLASSNLALGNMEEAEKYYNINIKNHPDKLWSYGNYADMLLREKKDTTAAIQLYKKASVNVSHNDDYFLAQSGIYFFRGLQDSALLLINKAIEFNPNNVSALNILANFESRSNKDYIKAEQYIKQHVAALEKSSYDSYMKMSAYNSYAMNDYRLGKIDSAYVHVRKAISYLPEYGIPYTTLAEIYYLDGRINDFYKTFQKALDLGFEVREDLWNDEPYLSLKDDPKLRSMIEASALKN